MPVKPKRAEKGSIGGALLVRLSKEQMRDIKRAAKRDGVSAAEWVRRAALAFAQAPKGGEE